jgi:hypothetical protein
MQVLHPLQRLDEVDPDDALIHVLAAVAVALNLLLEVLAPAELHDHDENGLLCSVSSQSSGQVSFINLFAIGDDLGSASRDVDML